MNGPGAARATDEYGRGTAAVATAAQEPPDEVMLGHPTGDNGQVTGFPSTASSSDNIFAFNVEDLPYVPDPNQPRVQPQHYILPPYPSSDLDALIGAADPLSFSSMSRQVHYAQTQGFGNGAAAGPPSLDPTLGFSMDSPGVSPTYTQAPPDGSIWGMEDLSPTNTAFGTGSSGVLGDDRNAQREALLGAVGRLIQLASLL